VLLPSSKGIQALLGGDSIELELSLGAEVPPPAPHRVPAPDGTRFQSLLACVEAFGVELNALAASGHSMRGARLDLVVADSWLLYDIAEIDLRDLSDLAAESAVSALLADLAGVEAGSLVARWHTIARPALQVACAIPADAVAALNELVRRHRLRWAHAQGEFVRAFNLHRSEFDGVSTALAVVRPEGTQLGVVAKGVLAALHYEPGIPVFDRLSGLCESLLRRAGREVDESLRYLADAPQVELRAPWRSLPLATQ